jgi:glycosyltransferase involved in cell wall biosynthesis
MDKSTGDITVVVPTYNRRKTVGRALDSIRTQTVAPAEVIVVDDASSDGTAAWVRSVYPEVKLISLRHNGGAAHARNMAIQEACGDFIAFLDSDDKWDPDFLKESLEVLKNKPDSVLVASDVNMVLKNGERYVFQCRPTVDFPDTIEHLLLRNFITTMSCVVVKRDAVRLAGLLDENLRVVHDRDWYIRLAAFGRIVCTERPLVWRYFGADNLVVNLREYLRDVKRFQRRFFRTDMGTRYLASRRRLLAGTYEGFAGMAAGQGLNLAACRHYIAAFIYSCGDSRPQFRFLTRAGGAFVKGPRSLASRILRGKKRGAL